MHINGKDLRLGIQISARVKSFWLTVRIKVRFRVGVSNRGYVRKKGSLSVFV